MLDWLKKNKASIQRNIPLHFADYYISDDFKKQYVKNGFVIIKSLISEDIINELKAINQKFLKNLDKDFAYSTMIGDADVNIEIHHKTTQLVQPILDTLFKNYKNYSSTFLIKPAENGSEMKLHQDWSFTDENEFLPTTFWLPLQDVNEKNGAVFFIKKSHAFFKNYRSHSLPSARIASNGIIAPYIETANIKVGDLLLFNPAIFHGSHANSTEQHRIAYTTTIMADSARLSYFHYLDAQKIQIFHLDEFAFLTQMKEFNLTGEFSGEKIRTESYQHSIPSEKEIVNSCQFII
ncbi:MAG: phytanoyl-CoA dioxygenase family protein [Chitinophagales bacterium]|nr:phytanoyl-CoA dioxygenase family protein [Chitinophagales bacterium]